MARIWFAVVDVELAIFALVAFGAKALVGADEIVASGSILARVISTFIDFLLAIASKVSFSADALVAVSYVATMASILAQLVHAS